MLRGVEQKTQNVEQAMLMLQPLRETRLVAEPQRPRRQRNLLTLRKMQLLQRQLGRDKRRMQLDERRMQLWPRRGKLVVQPQNVLQLLRQRRQMPERKLQRQMPEPQLQKLQVEMQQEKETLPKLHMPRKHRLENKLSLLVQQRLQTLKRLDESEIAHVQN